MDDLITRAQLCAKLQVSEDTVRRYIRAGRITPIQIGRGGRFHFDSVVAQINAAPKRKRRAGRINP